MEEFLKDNYNVLTKSIEILAAVVGLLYYNKYKFSAAKYFIFFLIYLAIGDFISFNYSKYTSFQGTIFEKNYWWSTVYWKIGAILFFSYYYIQVLSLYLFKIILKYSVYSFLITSVFIIVTHLSEFFTQSFPLISVLGAVIILECAIFYFIEILRSDKILKFYKSLNFYISLAIFIWWLIKTPLVFYEIYNTNSDWNFVILKWQIVLFANIFMYTTFTIGLIVSKPEKG